MLRIDFQNLTPQELQMEMTNFVRCYTPQSWRKHLMPSMIQYWAMLLLRSAWGEVCPDLFGALGIHGKPHGGVGTWFATADEVNYVWSEAGETTVWKAPEWGLGVWREVTGAFHRFTSPHADWSDERRREDMATLAERLAMFSKGHPSFRALGLFGCTWFPADTSCK